ncbi:hypothetical protein E1267_43565, partial [Nonomuraea longispora]
MDSARVEGGNGSRPTTPAKRQPDAERNASHGEQAVSVDADLLGHRRRFPTGSPPVGAAVPNVARMYDFWLGGKDFYEVDREAAAM